MKTAGGATTIYHYDQWGQVIAESDASGTMLREYAYTRPAHGRARLAIIDSATAAIYPVVPDHLGTPLMITDLAGAPVWSADQLPFGQTTPYASNTISQHLRFPGQYSDTESGLHYNWNRYYDPSTGRYLTADPIGLYGGMNVYGYADGNPVNRLDLKGLEAVPIPFVPPVIVPDSPEQQKRNKKAAQGLYNWLREHYNPDNWIAQAWDYWTGEEDDDECEDIERVCQERYDTDIASCRAVGKRRGKKAAARCYKTAADRYAACLNGQPLPPLDVWNN